MSSTASETPITVPIDKVQPNPWNPNVVPEHILKALAANIERVGFNQPILVRPLGNGEYEIVDGEHRYTVAKEAGLQEIPVIVRNLNDSEAKAQTVAMNKLRGEMEPADVAALVKDIMGDINLEQLAEFTGYEFPELEALVALADFDFEQFDDSGDEDEVEDDDQWVTVSWRVPSDVEPIISSEVDRVKQLLNTDHDNIALEAIFVNSAATNRSAKDFTGE